MKKDILNRVKKVDFTIQRNFLNTKEKKFSSLDICLKWAPLLAVFALDAFDDESEGKLEKHFVDALTGILILNATVFPLKHIIKRVRPNGKLKSFPSRHTATSFLGSEMLRQSLKEKHPAWSYSGYAVAAGTAVLRLYRNKHWFSDVLTGAAIGVFSVKLAPLIIDKVIYNTNIQPAV
jgi:membrane-associated phospholipid phosphatase